MQWLLQGFLLSLICGVQQVSFQKKAASNRSNGTGCCFGLSYEHCMLVHILKDQKGLHGPTGLDLVLFVSSIFYNPSHKVEHEEWKG